MGANPPGRFSPDGLWWWDGSQWRPAVSADRMWRWDGQRWVANAPMQVRQPSGGGAAGIVITIFAAIGILVLTSVVVIVVLLAMGNQLTNVFQNVVTALGASPTP